METQNIQSQEQEVLQLIEEAFAIDFANGENPLRFAELVYKARELSLKMGFEYGIARSTMGEGVLAYMQNNLLLSIDRMKEALDIFEKLGKDRDWAVTLTFMGMGYWSVGDFGRAFDLSLKSLQIFEKIGNEPSEMVFTLYMLGSHYLDLRDFENAEKHFLRAINLEILPEQCDLQYERRLARNLIGLSNVSQVRGEYEKSLELLNQAIALQEKTHDSNGISRAYNDIAKTYKKIGNKEKTLEFFEKSLQLRRGIYDKQALITTLLDMAEFYIEQQDYETAFPYLQEGKEWAEKISAKHKVARSHQLLSRLYKLQGNFEKSLEHFEIFFTIREQVEGSDTSMKIRQLQTRFEIENKEKEAEIYRLRNVELKKLHDEVQAKNKNIVDSINYAQRIQQAILPLPEQIQRFLPQHFVFFKPRDIVSGDFYFFAENTEKVALAAVDCTGHGVPGAFMSMIGNEILNEILLGHNNWETDQVLNELDKGIQKALKQQETSNRDGMDISLVILERNPVKQTFEKLSFAGAKNSLVLVENGQLEVLEADRFSIGGGNGRRKNVFTKKEKVLKQEIVFYLFSDGFQDQFGGEDGRKFMVKNFKKLLFDISEKPIAEQKEILAQTFEHWKKEHKQTDDVLVLGVRV